MASLAECRADSHRGLYISLIHLGIIVQSAKNPGIARHHSKIAPTVPYSLLSVRFC